MSYNLNEVQGKEELKKSTLLVLNKLLVLIKDERKNLIIALVIILVNAALSLTGPYLIGYAIDHYVLTKQYHGLLVFCGILLTIYLGAFITNYLQMILMGGVGQRMLFSLRNAVFNKLQELPVDFFNQNKAGDLISRINNDTDKVNQFFSQSLMQFISSLFTMIGAAVFLLSIHLTLGAATLLPAVAIWIYTRAISPWVKKRNAASLKSTGNLSAEIQESLDNFKVVVAFNRRDYFRKRFDMANQENYKASVGAGMANNVLAPVYGFSSNIGQLIVLALGIYLIMQGSFSVGLLIGFLGYVMNFYNPLRHIAGLWASFQTAMAAWDRISRILALESNLLTQEEQVHYDRSKYLVFQEVTFKYPNGKEVLHKVSFDLERGKTYAFVGPTGGGKTTTASLLARLYDATKGVVILDGRDIRTYSSVERTSKIGFILQEPFLFSGTIRDNILYGNEAFQHFTHEALEKEIQNAGLDGLLQRFDQGLDTQVQTSGDGISLGQKQIIAFMRAVLRKPELLILDEATANIDTVTEQLLDQILEKLPATTTRVIIAHRLNTIENADEIFFVNSGKVLRAGSLEDAVNLLLHGKRDS